MKWLFMLSLVFVSIQKQRIEIDSITVYKNFLKGGTTTGFIRVFENPAAYKVENVKLSVSKEDVFIFTDILNEAKVKRHYQQKIVADKALLVTIEGLEHYFLISNDKLIDLTDKVEYKLINSGDKNKFVVFCERYK